jgi:hypothetical protein
MGRAQLNQVTTDDVPLMVSILSPPVIITEAPAILLFSKKAPAILVGFWQ